MIVGENVTNVTTSRQQSERIIAYCSLVFHSPQFVHIAWNTNRIGNNKNQLSQPEKRMPNNNKQRNEKRDFFLINPKCLTMWKR